MENHPSIRGTRLLQDIYQRSNVAYANLLDTKKLLKTGMEEEMSMIQKNKTSELVDRSKDRTSLK